MNITRLSLVELRYEQTDLAQWMLTADNQVNVYA